METRPYIRRHPPEFRGNDRYTQVPRLAKRQEAQWTLSLRSRVTVKGVERGSVLRGPRGGGAATRVRKIERDGAGAPGRPDPSTSQLALLRSG